MWPRPGRPRSLECEPGVCIFRSDPSRLKISTLVVVFRRERHGDSSGLGMPAELLRITPWDSVGFLSARLYEIPGKSRIIPLAFFTGPPS